MTGRTLGNDYTESYLNPLFEGNKKAGRSREQMLSERRAFKSEHDLNSENPAVDIRPEYDPSYDYTADPIAVLHFRTKLRLVVDLQTCAKAQISRAYARKVKLTNLQQMAQTICYVQEHGYGSSEDMEQDLQMNVAALSRLNDTIRFVETQISELQLGNNRNNDQLEILRSSKTQLLNNRNNLSKNISNLRIIESNVNAILHQEYSHTRDIEKAQDR